MNKIFINKKNLILISVVGIFCAILVACLEVSPNLPITLENAFLFARDGYIEIKEREYNADSFNCTLNLLLFIPLISQILTNDYEIAKSFIFVRKNNVVRWYSFKILQCFFYCFYSSFIYNLTLMITVALMGFDVSSKKTTLEYFVFGVIAGFWILFMLVITSYILSIKIKAHFSTTLIVVITVVLMGISCFLNGEQIQFFVLTNYFISWHMVMNGNHQFYYFSTWFYYAIILMIITAEIIIGNIMMKKNDHI